MKIDLVKKEHGDVKDENSLCSVCGGKILKKEFQISIDRCNNCSLDKIYERLDIYMKLKENKSEFAKYVVFDDLFEEVTMEDVDKLLERECKK